MPPVKKQVYIVDDDESVCRALKSLLMTYDFDVMTFNVGNIFLEVVAMDKPGCLIIDIHMPGLDGWAIQKKMMDAGSKRPVIFISADKQENAADRALKVGAVGFLQKPVDGQTLVDLINVSLENAYGKNK